jgi:hypothetical protein
MLHRCGKIYPFAVYTTADVLALLLLLLLLLPVDDVSISAKARGMTAASLRQGLAILFTHHC